MSKDIAYVTETELAEWKAEVTALPIRKQKHWHSAVDDRSGTMHRVRYYNGNFQMKTHNDRSKIASPWIPIVAHFQHPTRDQLVDAFGESAVREWEQGANGQPLLTSFQDHCAGSPTFQRLARAAECGGESALLVEGVNIINESATGNHVTRPRKIRIPTKAGEPVRG